MKANEVFALRGASFLLCLLLGCDEPRRPPPPLPSAADIKAAVDANIETIDGLIHVRDTLFRTLVVVPPSFPWIVKCGYGLTVYFGRDGEATSEVRISHGFLSQDACRELAPVAGCAVASVVSNSGVRSIDGCRF